MSDTLSTSPVSRDVIEDVTEVLRKIQQDVEHRDATMLYHKVIAFTSSAYMPPLLLVEVRVAEAPLARPDSNSSSGHGKGRFDSAMKGPKLDNFSSL